MIPPPHVLSLPEYEAALTQAFDGHAKPWYWKIRPKGWPRAFTVGQQVTVLEGHETNVGLLAHEYAHAVNVDHPPLHEAAYWFDVRAPHPLRLTDKDDLKPRAMQWLRTVRS